MLQIGLEQVKRDNSNIRRYSDTLWRELRKTRFKPANPDAITNQMAAEKCVVRDDLDMEFRHDIGRFMARELTAREGALLQLFLYGGGMTQTEMAEYLGVCQSTVAQTLKSVFRKVKEEFYGVH